MERKVNKIYSYDNIDNLIPGIRGQRAFPSREFRNSDPFLMLDHIGPQHVGSSYFLDGTGHEHPHRGFETLTFMFEGKMEHVDSIGNKVMLESGSVQRMNAGSGIMHGGNMHGDASTERFHELQLWVNNPAAEKMSTPEIQNASTLQIPNHEEGNMNLRMISGTLNGVEGPLKTKAQTKIGHIIAEGNGAIELTGFEEGETLMLYILEGAFRVEQELLASFHLADFNKSGESLTIQAEGKAQLLVLAGKPLNESVAFGGPFVMNTQEEIWQANMDFQQGLFGTIEA